MRLSALRTSGRSPVPYVPFCDVTGASSPNIPAVPALGIIALYATGSDGIAATSDQIARFRSAGAGVVLIDQTPSLSVFAAGYADVADVEPGAGTFEAAAAAVLERQAHGWQSTIYLSYSNLQSMVDALSSEVDRKLVIFGVADYSWSQAEAEQLLAQNPSWAYCQFGDPQSNPDTLVPGTDVTLSQANADIDVAQSWWADQFLPHSDPAPKAFPTPTGLSQAAYASVDVGWDAVAGAGSYHVQIAAGGKVVADETVTTPYLHGTPLHPGTAYQWRVAVHAAAGVDSSPWSEWIEFTS
jgi:hypothetical protein